MGTGRRLLPLALAVILIAGCGGSSKAKGPPDLIFVSPRDGDYAIFGADAQGDNVRRLTKAKGDPSTPAGLFFQLEPTWSPDGLQIAFASKRDGSSHIFAMQADGSGTRRLTNGSKEDTRPAWSPDGATIVFGREGALFAVPAGVGKARRIGHGLGNAANPAWSPDGKLIVYDYRKPGFSIRELWLMKADGSGIHRLTKLRDVAALPAWSPDGKRIAFQSYAGRSNSEIYTISRDGTGVRRETDSGIYTISPAWSPDGKLTFSRDGSLWAIDGTGKETRLTAGSGNDSSPAWRPVRSG
jgi:Tol biopolymer transport system component